MLASRSPRRADLLRSAGYRFTVRPSSTAEKARAGEAPAAVVTRLAMEKAVDVARRRRVGLVLGADTIVVVGGEILGKPADDGEARRMLRHLSGRAHRVVTGVALCEAGGRLIDSASASTTVVFNRLSRAEIDWYVATGDPVDKAGAYGIQGGAALFVRGIRGSYSNVVGLPLEVVYSMLGLPP